jgi:hypothetical protein
MAIYHCHMQIINRASGRSSVAAAAYRSGEKLRNERDGLTHDFTRKSGIVCSQIILPENAPARFASREKLWNAVEKSEKRKDAQTAREIEVALPRELPRQQQVELVRAFIAENFTGRGMIADFSLHDKNDGNPHAHVMLTMRTLTKEGFGNKERSWNDRKNAEIWREAWAKAFNRSLERNGAGERVDHRSYRRQGLDLIPTLHLGARANGLEKRGIPTDRGEQNRRAQNARRNYLELSFLQQEKTTILAREKQRLSRLKNRYLEKALELGGKKAAAQSLLVRAGDYRNRARSITDLASFMDQTRGRIELIGQELRGCPDPGRQTILSRQRSQLERSLLEDRKLLFSRFGIEGGLTQAGSKAREWLRQAAVLETSLGEGRDLGLLEKLLEKLLRLILEAFRSLSGYLGPDLSLRSLDPFEGRERLSQDQQASLQAAEGRLEHAVSESLTAERRIEGPAQEQSRGFSPGR